MSGTGREKDSSAVEAVRAAFAALFGDVRAAADTAGLALPPPELEEVIARVRERQYLALVVGEAKRGKSSFVNALIGREILPTAEEVATSQVFKVARAAADGCRVRFEDDSVEPIEAADLAAFGSEQGDRKAGDRLVRWIEVDIADLPEEFLPERLAIADTPGLGSLHASHKRVTHRFIPIADGVIFVLDSERPVTQDDLDYIDAVLAHTGNIFFIQSRIDLFSRDDWQDVLRRNLEILQERLPDHAGPLIIQPISSSNLMKARIQGDDDYLRASRFPELKARLQTFLFATAGIKDVIGASALLERYFRETNTALNGRLENLAEEASRQKSDVQGKLDARRSEYERAWGAHGEERKRLIEDVRGIVRQARTRFTQAIEPNGEIEAGFVKRVLSLSSVGEARQMAENFGDEASAAVTEIWTETCRKAQEEAVNRLGPFLLAGDAAGPDQDGGKAGVASGPATITARDDLWTLLVGGRSASVQSGLTAGVLASIGTTVLAFAWFPPAALIGVAAAAVWGLFTGMKDTKYRQVEQARNELRRHVVMVMTELRRHFLGVEIGRDSRVAGYFSTLEAKLVEAIDKHAGRRLAELQAESDQLQKDFQLDEEGRSRRIAEINAQRSAWRDRYDKFRHLLARAMSIVAPESPASDQTA